MDQLKKPRNQYPLQGVTLEMVVTRLEEEYGWEELVVIASRLNALPAILAFVQA
jgi:uncharacterized protein (DUF2132 family)